VWFADSRSLQLGGRDTSGERPGRSGRKEHTTRCRSIPAASSAPSPIVASRGRRHKPTDGIRATSVAGPAPPGNANSARRPYPSAFKITKGNESSDTLVNRLNRVGHWESNAPRSTSDSQTRGAIGEGLDGVNRECAVEGIIAH
jgi:hypothetical protein